MEVLGGDVREMEIVLDPARTAALRLSPSKVAEKVRDATVLQAVGRFDDAHALVTVMASGEPKDARDLGSIPIAVGAGGSPIPLSTIAPSMKAPRIGFCASPAPKARPSF